MTMKYLGILRQTKRAIAGLVGCFMGGSLSTAPVMADIMAGKQAMQDENYAAAVELFEPDLSVAETSFEAHLHTGKALLLLGQAKKAIAHLNTAIELDVSHTDTLYTWAMAKGELAEKAVYSQHLAISKRHETPSKKSWSWTQVT